MEKPIEVNTELFQEIVYLIQDDIDHCREAGKTEDVKYLEDLYQRWLSAREGNE